MLCPICKSQLDSIETLGIKIDVCSFCEGIWFDSGELERFYHSASAPGSKNPFKGAVFKKGNIGKVRSCPRCESDKLVFGTVADRDVWRCDDCQGFFVFKSIISDFAPKDPIVDVSVGIEALALLLSGLS